MYSGTDTLVNRKPLVIPAYTFSAVRRIDPHNKYESVPHYLWSDQTKTPLTYLKNSTAAAMALALHLRASDVHIFGADMEGDEDWSRCESRWVLEREDFARMVDHLEKNGVKVWHVSHSQN